MCISAAAAAAAARREMQGLLLAVWQDRQSQHQIPVKSFHAEQVCVFISAAASREDGNCERRGQEKLATGAAKKLAAADPNWLD